MGTGWVCVWGGGGGGGGGGGVTWAFTKKGGEGVPGKQIKQPKIAGLLCLGLNDDVGLQGTPAPLYCSTCVRLSTCVSERVS